MPPAGPTIFICQHSGRIIVYTGYVMQKVQKVRLATDYYYFPTFPKGVFPVTVCPPQFTGGRKSFQFAKSKTILESHYNFLIYRCFIISLFCMSQC